MKQSASKERVGGIGTEAVAARTGRTWAQWIKALDAAGCRKMDHKGIVAEVVRIAPDIGGWWSQMVTVGYEQARGLREKHQKPAGYEIGASKTIGVPVSKLFRAWKDGRTRARWLPGEAFDIRKATANKSMRITWSDGKTHVDVSFYAKGDGKSQVAVQHKKLASAAAADRMKKFWRGRLAALKGILEG